MSPRAGDRRARLVASDYVNRDMKPGPTGRPGLRRATAFCLEVLLAWGSVLPARAQGPVRGGVVAQGGNAEHEDRAPAAGSGSRAQARELYELGKRAYEAGDFEAALDAWRGCLGYASTPLERARALWIVAQAYRKLGDCPHASQSYLEYLQSPAADEARTEAEYWLAELNQRCPAAAPNGNGASESPGEPGTRSAEQPAAVPPATMGRVGPVVPSPPPSYAAAGPRVPWLAWSLFGAAAVSAAASAAYAAASGAEDRSYHRLAEQFRQSQRSPAAFGGLPTVGDQLASVQRRGRRDDALAWVFGGGALALSTAGAMTVLLDSRGRRVMTAWSISVEPSTGLVIGQCSSAF